MPMDQHLSLNGVALTDDTATVISLGIRPGSLLLLKVDCYCCFCLPIGKEMQQAKMEIILKTNRQIRKHVREPPREMF